jgi:hypothetical protein
MMSVETLANKMILEQTSASAERHCVPPSSQPQRCEARYEIETVPIERVGGIVQLQQRFLLRGQKREGSLLMDE